MENQHMRALRVSPLMRRASSHECGDREGASKETSTNLPGQVTWVHDEDKEQAAAALTLQKKSAGSDSQMTASNAMITTATALETSMFSPSTPTRGNLGGRQTNSDSFSSKISDADWAHAQLQQMWDDGELSPRAPLDRSLGYFSSASPVSIGKRSSRGAPEICETGKISSSKDKSQQCPDAPLFINDLRALRQMAPFSSTEEQVLTRSQRRRSSVNLLQQLVAGQPEGHNELQRTSPVSVAQGARGRKRRASSPAAPGYPCTPHRRDFAKEPDAVISFEGLPRTKGRKRYSSSQGATQEDDKVSTSSASFQCSRRSSVGTGEIARSSSGNNKIASPFQKLPPPSPSDFPLASPLRGSSLHGNSCCSPRRADAQPQDQQLRQTEGREILAEKPLEHALTKLQKQSHEGSPLGKSARLSHGAQEARSCPFDTQRSPRCSAGPLNSVTSPVRSCQGRAMPVPIGRGSLCCREATDQPCNDELMPSEANGLLLQNSGAKTSPKSDASAKNEASVPKKSAAFRRSSAARLKASKNAAHGADATLAGVKGTSQALADRETVAQAEMDKIAFSPVRRRTFNQTGRTHETRGDGASLIAADGAHQSERRTASKIPSTCAKKQQDQRADGSTCMALCCCSSGQSGSSLASAAVTAAGRRHSTGRRASRLPRDINTPVCVTSDNLSHEKCGPPWRPVIQEASAAGISVKRPGVSEGNRGEKTSARSKGASSRQTAWLKSRSTAIVSRTSPRILPQGRILQTETAVFTSARDTKSGSKEGSRSSHVSNGIRIGSALNSLWRRPVLAAAKRLSGRKLCSETSSSLQQRRNGLSVAGDRIKALPITKARNTTVSAAAKQQRADGASAPRTKPASTAVGVRGPRWHSGRSALRSRVISVAASSQAVVRQRRQPTQCAPPERRTSSPSGSCTQAKETPATPPEVPTSTGKQSEPAAGGAAQDSTQPPKGLASQSKLRVVPESSAVPHEDVTRHTSRCTRRTSVRSECAIGDKDCTASTTVSLSLQRSQRASASSVVVVADEGEPTQSPTCGDTCPHEKRRSSDPQYPLSQKAATDALGEQEHYVRECMRRASSACEASICLEQRSTEHQQQHDAQQQEWEIRDRKFQERQQNLLLEQQKKERLLAWEQREAELLKNRKALSKEEPSFWGFDPFMVDEEDEKVLTTEELRVEVSRFLKGDLRFHSRADLLRVVKKFSEQTRTTTTTTSSKLNFAKVEQRVVPMAARQVHGPVPHERRRKSILRSSSGAQQSECRRRSRGISFSPFNKVCEQSVDLLMCQELRSAIMYLRVSLHCLICLSARLRYLMQVQLYMLDEHERASKEAAANLSQQGEQRQQMRQKLAEQFQLMLLRGESDIELSLLRRELAELYDPDEEEELAFLSPTLAANREVGKDRGFLVDASQSDSKGISMQADKGGSALLMPEGAGVGGRLPFTISPSWRQKPHRVWHASEAAHGGPTTEWSPSSSPFEHNPLTSADSKEGSECWDFPSNLTKSDPETNSMQGAFGNDENANCNAASTMAAKSSDGKSQQPVNDERNKESFSAFDTETAKRPSVLRRRLSIVPNVQSP
ncbi:hypothetical protein Emag_004924 [Eimeria magna]